MSSLILYFFKLLLEFSSYLTLDIIYKSFEIFEVFLKKLFKIKPY